VGIYFHSKYWCW